LSGGPVPAGGCSASGTINSGIEMTGRRRPVACTRIRREHAVTLGGRQADRRDRRSAARLIFSRCDLPLALSPRFLSFIALCRSSSFLILIVVPATVEP
jgi:hypothetical protein